MKWMKSYKYRYCLFFIVFLCLGIIACKQVQTGVEPEIEIRQGKVYEDTLVVAADYQYPPFSYVNAEGSTQGYDIELVYRLAEKLEMNVELKLMKWPEPCDAVMNGDADIVLGIEYQEGNKDRFELSKPVQVNEFVAFGEKDFTTINELYCKRVGALENSISHELFLEPLDMMDEVRLFKSYEQAFQAILDDELDYLIGRYSVGRRVLVQEDITSVDARGSVLANNAFCIGVQKGNIELLNKLNTAIDELNEEGVINELTNKWLGNFVNLISFRDIISRYKDEVFLIGFMLVLISSYYLFDYHKKRLKRVTEQNLRAYQDVIMNITNKMYERINEYNVTKNCIANDYTVESLRSESISPDMSYSEIVEYEAKYFVEGKFKEQFINTFKTKNIKESFETGKNTFSYEYLRLDKTKSYVWVQDIVYIFSKGEDIHIIVLRKNIDQVKKKENLLVEQSRRDSATGFYNKLATEEAINYALLDCKTQLNALLIIDIDNFKQVNDTYGHVFGDYVIQTITNEIKTIFRSNDILGRVGGDEFIIFMTDIRSIKTACRKGEEISKVIKELKFEGGYTPTLSIGIAKSKVDDDFESMFRRADKALYDVKENGRNGCMLYQEDQL